MIDVFCTGIVVSKFEDTNTYLWILQNIRNFFDSKGLGSLPRNIIADNASQVSNAVSLLDTNLLRTNCWAHISRLMNPVFSKIRDTTIRSNAMKEVHFLQALTSRDLFIQGVNLFRTKYIQFDSTRGFIGEFISKFFENNCNWG